MAVRKFYKGFSTRTYEQGGSLARYDVACIAEDLSNEIFTVKGERLYMPDYGTRIPLLVFEPNDEDTIDILKEDVAAVIEKDPRVELVDIGVVQYIDMQMLVCVAKVKYIEFDVTDDLYINVTSR
jgi:phage baseplate assembly protein W